MPQRDVYHEPVKQALIKDGWTITHDPYKIDFADDKVYIDLGAERLLAAQRDADTIAVEVKTFTGPSIVADIEQALGQYLVYRSWLTRTDPARALYLAVSEETADSVLLRPAIQVLLEDYQLRIVIVNVQTQEIVAWKP